MTPPTNATPRSVATSPSLSPFPSTSASREPFGLLRLPDRIAFGFGAVQAVPGTARRLGRRAFLCCDPHLAQSPEFSRLVEGLAAAGVHADVWTKIIPELPVHSVEAAAAAAGRPDLVIGFGGGSSLDLAKLVALLVSHGGPLGQYYGENAVPGPVLPVIAIPTTAGTGSEVTPVAVVSDPDRELKVGVSSPELVPRHAIVDPGLTLGAPAGVTAYAGIDALVHAMEALTARTGPAAWALELPVFVGRNRLSSLLAGEAARLIIENLATAVQRPDDLAAREAMAYGSLLAGMAFGSAGTHLSHAIQYPVGALTKTPHGLGTGLLLPYVLRGCLPEIRPDLTRLADDLGLTGDAAGGGAGGGDAAERLIAVVEELTARIGIPATLADIGISEDQLSRIAELAGTISRLANNAVAPATPERIDRIVRAAWSGDVEPTDQQQGAS